MAIIWMLIWIDTGTPVNTQNWNFFPKGRFGALGNNLSVPFPELISIITISMKYEELSFIVKGRETLP